MWRSSLVPRVLAHVHACQVGTGKARTTEPTRPGQPSLPTPPDMHAQGMEGSWNSCGSLALATGAKQSCTVLLPTHAGVNPSSQWCPWQANPPLNTAIQ